MEKLQGWLKLFHPIKSIIKLALGREIRYVEYKLRRQKQEKKKMKQAQKDFTYGTNSMYEPNNGGGQFSLNVIERIDSGSHYYKKHFYGQGKY